MTVVPGYREYKGRLVPTMAELERQEKGESLATGKITTHRTIEHKLEMYMAQSGWRKSRATLNEIRPDAIYKNKLVNFDIIAEVKPSIANKGEILKGIGQALQALPNKRLKSILVIPQDFIPIVKPIFNILNDALNNRFGLLTYGPRGQILSVIKVWSLRIEEDDLAWLEG